jgi:hypothetical protein
MKVQINTHASFFSACLQHSIEVRAKRLLVQFMFDKAQKDDMKLHLHNTHDRICFIQRKYKAVRGYYLEQTKIVTELVEQGQDYLLKIYNGSKKLKKSHPELLEELKKLTSDTVAKTVSHYITYTKQLHMLRLLRWYGEHVFYGKYNIPSFFKLIEAIELTKRKIDDALFSNKVFPQAEVFKKMAIKQRKSMTVDTSLTKISAEGDMQKVSQDHLENTMKTERESTGGEPNIDYLLLIGREAEPKAKGKEKQASSFA